MSELSLEQLTPIDRSRCEPLLRGHFDYDAARERYMRQVEEARARRDAVTMPMEYRPVTRPPKLEEAQ